MAGGGSGRQGARCCPPARSPCAVGCSRCEVQEPPVRSAAPAWLPLRRPLGEAPPWSAGRESVGGRGRRCTCCVGGVELVEWLQTWGGSSGLAATPHPGAVPGTFRGCQLCACALTHRHTLLASGPHRLHCKHTLHLHPPYTHAHPHSPTPTPTAQPTPTGCCSPRHTRRYTCTSSPTSVTSHVILRVKPQERGPTCRCRPSRSCAQRAASARALACASCTAQRTRDMQKHE